MEKYINIIEENNQLRFDGEYEPIVCGNSIYSLRFSFSDVWNECQHKTAIFVVDGNYIMVEFAGNEVKIPVLPNASYLSVSLVSGSGEHALATTALKLNLKTTPSACEITNSEMFNGYLQQIHALINKIENGEIEVNESKIAKNVINNNLLINGDFRVNQRGKTVYERASGRVYTVDRWSIWNSNGTFNAETKSLTNLVASGNIMLSQYIEDSEILFGKTITLSVNINDEIYSATGTTDDDYSVVTTDKIILLKEISSLFYIRVIWDKARQAFRVDIGCTPSIGSLVLKYAKLEIGSIATKFVPRSYAEEFEMCQRYYQKIKGFKRAISQYSFYDGFNVFSSPMRTTPTMKVFALNNQQNASINENSMFNVNTSSEIEITVPVAYQSQLGFKTQCGNGIFVQNNEYQYLVVCDAEIY